jgi:hypothetical protein
MVFLSLAGSDLAAQVAEPLGREVAESTGDTVHRVSLVVSGASWGRILRAFGHSALPFGHRRVKAA